MKILKPLSLILTAYALGTSLVHAQSREGAKPEIDKVISRLYRNLSFTSNWTGADSVSMDFVKGAQLIAAFGQQPQAWTPEDYVSGVKDRIQQQRITRILERELSYKQFVFGKIAQRFSTYEITIISAGKEIKRLGINALQLIEENGHWKVASLVWDRESDTLKVPAEFRP